MLERTYMVLLEDTRNQIEKHKRKNAWWAEHGVEVRRTKLYCGDYTLPTNQSICIDSKKDIQELIGDICGKQHDRFRAECERASEAGIKLIILVENAEGYADKNHKIWNKCIRDVSELHSWTNPRLCLFRNGKQLYPTATRGITLQKACMTMTQKYGVEFLFCHYNESAKKILELLGGE